jgi:hypothetical protein
MSLLSELGLDPDNLQWHQLALCDGMPLTWFYDSYESDSEIAKAVDDVCLNCPVIKECGLQGAGGEYGVWGGIYWSGNGKPDKAKNSHKTEDDWKAVRGRYV